MLRPTPWKLTDNGSAFVIHDAKGKFLSATYYARSGYSLPGQEQLLSKDEARAVAQAFARVSRKDSL